ncbi:MAG: DUF4124 domain-containing protein [Luteimonas sp.]
MRRFHFTLLALPCALLLLSMPLAAQQVYKWKDAKGRTQYSSVPPTTGSYEAREVDHHKAPVVAASATSNPDPVCDQARANLVLLKGQASVQLDSDGDGKPDKTLSEAERADQVALTEATLKVRCMASAPVPAPEDASEGDSDPEPEEM